MKSNNGARPARDRKNEQARRLDRQKVLELKKLGVSNHDIAVHQSVNHSTIWRFLSAIQPQQKQLATFKERRADCLANIHGQALDVQELLLERMRHDLGNEVLTAAMSATEKSRWLQAAVIAGGVSYDKERIERGLSSANVSLMSWQREAEESLFKKKGHEKKGTTP